jgi:type I restriction enzyme R subunit
VLESTFPRDALTRAKGIVQSFEQFIQDHKDEITALQIIYSMPHKKRRLSFEHIKELADRIAAPPYLWNESQLWQAYEAFKGKLIMEIDNTPSHTQMEVTANAI